MTEPTRYEVEVQGWPDVAMDQAPACPETWYVMGRAFTLERARWGAARFLRARRCRVRIVACHRSRVLGVVEEMASAGIQARLEFVP